jgi:hypothetical protein
MVVQGIPIMHVHRGGLARIIRPRRIGVSYKVKLGPFVEMLNIHQKQR